MPDWPPMLVALARAAHHRGRELGVDPAELDAAELAVLTAGWATLTVSPFNGGRDEEIASLRGQFADAVPAILASPGAADWHQPLRLGRQVWVGECPVPEPSLLQPNWQPFPAYAAKPRGGFWTSTELPRIASVWATDEPMDWTAPLFQPWRARITKPVRCYEIDSIADWVALCERFPADTTDAYRFRAEQSALPWPAPCITPDWARVQEEYDAVHLTWWGYMEASYVVVPVRGGTTCLSGWGSESTLWFRWIFDDWTPIDLAS